MMTTESPRRGDRRDSGVCGNEGCERPAQGRLCDACGLEWSLFHRESRFEAPETEVSTPPDHPLEP